MKNWLLQIFTWWNGQTLGTRFFTWRNGVCVGKDSLGNVYYKTKVDHPLLGERRWVIYNGEAEASALGDGWYSWLQHMRDDVPNANDQKREWELPAQANMTGTSGAYKPTGAVSPKAVAGADYQAWKP